MSLNLSNPYTILNDRVLWYDGDSSYTVNALTSKILAGDATWVDQYIIDPDDFSVVAVNKLNDDVNLKAKDEVVIPDDSYVWKIPNKYMEINIEEHIYTALLCEFKEQQFSLDEENVRIDRIREEFILWTDSGMINLLLTLIYIVDTFELTETVWGTGRGSSCCSYILFLLGVHDVDSIKYELDITDFFRT
jgi:DNA polymerase III alpha subunit